jgi:hypothetical protein
MGSKGDMCRKFNKENCLLVYVLLVNFMMHSKQDKENEEVYMLR